MVHDECDEDRTIPLEGEIDRRTTSTGVENAKLHELLARAVRFVHRAEYWATGTRAQRFREKRDAKGLAAQIDAVLGPERYNYILLERDNQELKARIAGLERQNADLQAANNRYLERARRAEADNEVFVRQLADDTFRRKLSVQIGLPLRPTERL